MNDLTREQWSILDHTINRAARGIFCGDSEDMQALVAAGLMQFAGRVSWVPDPYFRITDAGRDAWRQQRPEPKPMPKVSARKRRSQERYRLFLRMDYGGTFREFLRRREYRK